MRDVRSCPKSGRQPAALTCPLIVKADIPLVCVRPNMAIRSKNQGFARSGVITRWPLENDRAGHLDLQSAAFEWRLHSDGVRSV